MSASLLFTLVFAVFLLLTTLTRFWLAQRQIRYVTAHRQAVPSDFAEKISLVDHQKAADYTCAKTRFALVELFFSVAVTVGFTLLGGLDYLNQTLRAYVGVGLLAQLGLFVCVGLISGLLDLPFSWIRQFKLEAQFGFNRMTPALFIADLVKSTLLGAAIGLPLLWVILWLMQSLGDQWWWAAWLVWVGFNLLALVLFPTLIAPLFNKFVPLDQAELKARIEGLLSRCGFQSKGVFVMDGSKRSSHGNAYFTGLGKNKRIVFFDTLIERLQPAEIEAVLAHELGHYKHKHILKRIIWSFAASALLFAVLGYLVKQSWFYTGLGVTPTLNTADNALALLLFFMALPVFTFFFAPLSSIFSRKHEFEADAFACANTSGQDLANALIKLYQDNAATLTPDPAHSAFYDSHPPALQRIARIATHTAQPSQ